MDLIRINRFLADNKMPPSKFGRLAVGDPRLVFDIRNGRGLRQSMKDRLITFMDNYVPQPVAA